MSRGQKHVPLSVIPTVLRLNGQNGESDAAMLWQAKAMRIGPLGTWLFGTFLPI